MLHRGKNWLVNLSQPLSTKGGRIWHEPGRFGPRLEVPRRWLLVEVVVAAINAEKPGTVPPLEATEEGGAIRSPRKNRTGIAEKP